MQCETETYEKLLANFELLCSIMRQPGKNQELVVDLTKIEEIIRKKFLILWGKNAPEDFLYAVYGFLSQSTRSFVILSCTTS